MKITKVSTHVTRSYIPLKGWESVEIALSAYDNGDVSGSRATTDKLFEDIEERHGKDASIIALSASLLKDKSDFVSKMLKKAKKSVDTAGRWSEGYDYDAMGTNFFKSDIEIVCLDSDTYGLRLTAAYVGDEPEANIASHFGINRCIRNIVVGCEIAPDSANTFSCNFDVVLEKLKKANLHLAHTTGSAIVKVLMDDEMFSSSGVHIAQVDGYDIALNLENIGHREVRKIDTITDTWSANGGTLSGNLKDDYRVEGKKMTPVINLVIKKAGVNSYSPKSAIWDPAEQEEVIALSNSIADALR